MEKTRDSDLCQGLNNCLEVCFHCRWQVLPCIIIQPGVCFNRNQVSSWTGWKIVPSAQESESTGLCCPNKFFSKALCYIMWVTVNWGTCAKWDTRCLHWSPYSNSFLLPKTPWHSTTSSDHRITLFSDKTFAFLHKLILWYNSFPCIQTSHFTTGGCTAVEYKWPVQVTSDSDLTHAAIETKVYSYMNRDVYMDIYNAYICMYKPTQI